MSFIRQRERYSHNREMNIEHSSIYVCTLYNTITIGFYILFEPLGLASSDLFELGN